jgi:hypothetical protein
MKITNNIEDEIKDKIIDQITLGVSGRLIVSKFEKNKFGADLLVEKRGDYKGKDLLFKICSFVGPSSTKIEKVFLQNEFKPDKNFYLIFVYFDSVKQKIGDFIWLIPSSQFENIAELVKGDNKFLRFESSIDIKNKDKYSKYIICTKNLGKSVLSVFDSDSAFKPLKDFKEEKIVDLKLLKDFIAEARANTYASGNEKMENPRLVGSAQFEFQKREFFYRDIYFLGNKKFMGQEIVYEDLKPIWGMNYIGEKIDLIRVNFLKEALLRLSDKCRLGQKCEFKKREFKYEDTGQGDIDNFFGQEKISISEKQIYKLEYKGGLISDRV